MAWNTEIFHGVDKMYLCFYFTITKGDFFSSPDKAPRSLRRDKLLNLPSSSLIHFLERKQKENTHSRIFVDDLPPNCWKLWSKVNYHHLAQSVAEALHLKLGALVHGLAGFGAVSDREKTCSQFTCYSMRDLTFQNSQRVSFYLYTSYYIIQNRNRQTDNIKKKAWDTVPCCKTLQ